MARYPGEDAHSAIAMQAYENGWRDVRNLVYMIPSDRLREAFDWAFEEEEEED